MRNICLLSLISSIMKLFRYGMKFGNMLMLVFLLWTLDWGDEKRIDFIVFRLDKVVDFMPTYLQGAMEKSEST